MILNALLRALVLGNANPKELLRLKSSLRAFEEIKVRIRRIDNPELTELVDRAFDSTGLTGLLEKAISEEAPLLVANGDVFNFGYDKELDELIKISKNSRQFHP